MSTRSKRKTGSAAEEKVDLSTLTVAALKTWARDTGVSIKGLSKKADILARILVSGEPTKKKGKIKPADAALPPPDPSAESDTPFAETKETTQPSTVSSSPFASAEPTESDRVTDIRPPKKIKFELLWGCAASGDNIFITDSFLHRVVCFKPDGSFVRSFGSKGSADGQFDCPDGIVYAEGSLFIADSGNKRISVFKPDGTFQRKWIIPFFPTAISFGEGRLLIGDVMDQIHVYGLNGTLERSFGSRQKEGGSLNSVRGIAYSNGLVFVSNRYGHCVSVFRADGSLVGVWGSKGSGPGQLWMPHGITVVNDRLFVADSEDRSVSVWSVAGAFVGRIGPRLSDDVKLSTGPIDLVSNGSSLCVMCFDSIKVIPLHVIPALIQ